MSTETGPSTVRAEAVHPSVAERMRLYRRRRSRKLRCVRVLVAPAEIDGLIAKGYLPSDKRNDPEAISSAIDNLMVECLTYQQS